MNQKILSILLVLGFILIPRLTVAQSTAMLESKVSRLEAENFQLRSRLDRLESEVNRIAGRSSFSASPPVTAPIPRQPNRQVSSTDPMFNRLATLVIELKERVQQLEEKMKSLSS